MCFLHLELLLFLESTLVRHIAEGIPLVDVHKYIKGKKKKSMLQYQSVFIKPRKSSKVYYLHMRGSILSLHTSGMAHIFP